MGQKKNENAVLILGIMFVSIGLILILLPSMVLEGALFLIVSSICFIYYGQKYFTAEEKEVVSESTKVVAIDDEDDILRLIRIKLSKEGFEVITATDGIEGIRTVLSEKPDVVVVDVMMPGKDGYEVVSEVKKKLGLNAPVVIMLTSKADEGDMVRGLSAGADDYITKPFSPSELIERINVALIKGKKDSY